MSHHRVVFGDALDVLRGLPAETVDCVFTSPPYWGLRDYQADGQIGLEPTPEEYVARLVAVFAEVRRVLRPWGTVALNLGDSYASSPGNASGRFRPGAGRADGQVDERGQRNRNGTPPTHGLKPKDLVGIPWRVAFALQADGWWLRNDVIWVKSNAMPESVRDRFASRYEHVFLLAKRRRYWFDLDAVRVPMSEHSEVAYPNGPGGQAWRKGVPGQTPQSGLGNLVCHPLGRNPGDVVTTSTQPTPYAHFATFPVALVLRFLPAMCPPRVCSDCGEPWEHRVEHVDIRDHPLRMNRNVAAQQFSANDNEYHDGGTLGKVATVRDLGYFPACACRPDYHPGTVLDPFLGSGTVTEAARRLGLNSIGIELNRDYEAVIRQRLGTLHTLEGSVTFNYS